MSESVLKIVKVVVRTGEREWVAADDAGWTDEVYATEDEAWAAIGGKHA